MKIKLPDPDRRVELAGPRVVRDVFLETAAPLFGAQDRAEVHRVAVR